MGRKIGKKRRKQPLVNFPIDQFAPGIEFDREYDESIERVKSIHRELERELFPYWRSVFNHIETLFAYSAEGDWSNDWKERSGKKREESHFHSVKRLDSHNLPG